MTEWKTIDSAPVSDHKSIIIYDPNAEGRTVIEARLAPDFTYYDPTYYEWFSETKATHWMPLPTPPTSE